MAGAAKDYPAGFAMFLIALSDYLEPPALVTVVPKAEDLHMLPFWMASDTIVRVLDKQSETYKPLNGETTIFVCKNHACLPPMTMPQFKEMCKTHAQ